MSARLSSSLALLALTSLVVACGPGAGSEEDPDAGLGSSQQAVKKGPAGFTPKAFASAAGCDDCEVLHWAPLNLPESKTSAASAKIRTSDGRFRIVTIDPSGRWLDEGSLLARERTLHKARHGKLEPALHTWLDSAKPEDSIWVWARVRFSADLGRREERLSPEGRARHADAEKSISDARAKVRDWIEKNASSEESGDDSGPVVRVKLKASEISKLQRLDVIEQLGTDLYPGKPMGGVWGSMSQWGATLRLPEAQAATTGSGARVCVKESTQPDFFTDLVVSAIANPTGPVSSHARAAVGLIRNTGGSPFTSIAPSAGLYVGNWGSGAVGSVDAFCQNNSTRTISYSHGVSGLTAGPLGGTDMQHDWLAKTNPYALVVAAAGDIAGWPGDAYVANRGFNGLVVGGVNDLRTADRTDDVWDSSAWQNPSTAHGDYELPHVVAPSNGADSVGTSLSGTSAATAMVAGLAALVESRGPDLASWPEGKRAVLIATATGRADQGLITSLGGTDHKIGAGEVDAYQAVDLAANTNAVNTMGGVSATKGRFGTSLNFTSDFAADGYSTRTWRVPVAQNGRLRVALVWDASSSCNGAGGTCSADLQDADLDLHVYKKAPGDGSYTATGVAMACSSSTWDSTWELCDFAVSAGDTYLISIKKFGTNATWTYAGLAWYPYQSPSGAPCNSSGECASNSCTAGRCTCTSDGQCPDRFCGSDGQCTTRLPFGRACTRAAECNTGACVDGVCCNVACDGACQACSATKKGTGIDGVCEFIADGRNPDHECSPLNCTGATLSFEGVCNGAGSCRANGSSSCNGYVCATSTSCGASCASDSGCASSHWCSGGACVPKKISGAACSLVGGAHECASGYCSDGMCCNAACDGLCQACSAAKKGSGADGVCGFIVDGRKPDHGCTTQSCSGTTLSNDWVCNGAGDCRSNGSSSCGGYTCGSETICATSCTSDAQCASTHWCSGGSCVAKKAVGAACSLLDGGGRECTSGNCVDGVCCSSTCTGTCLSCAAVNTGLADGTCGPTRDNLDPRRECAPATCTAGVQTNAWTCNGAGACRSAGSISCLGTACVNGRCASSCTSNDQCGSGYWCSASQCKEIWPTATLGWSELSETSVSLRWSAAHPNTASYKVYRNGELVGTTASSTRELTVSGLVRDVAYTFKVEAVDAGGSTSTNGPTVEVRTLLIPVAPTPSPITPGVATDVASSTQFLYSGTSPSQLELTTPIVPERAAVIRGAVRTGALGNACTGSVCDDGGTCVAGRCCASGDCSGVAGAKVTIVGGAYGYTTTRADGSYDLVVNGGGKLTVRIERAGSIPVQRTVDVPWQGYARVPDVVLTALDGKVTTVPMGSTKWEIAESSVSVDADGQRHVMMMFPPNVGATIEGATSTPTSLKVRATELTVGGSGLAAMPGELPPTTAYTYAVALTADEAAFKSVSFSQPVIFYVDNFVTFKETPDESSVRKPLPAGTSTPLGYYDPSRALWVPEASGTVIEIIGHESNGDAKLDVTGDGIADYGAALTDLGVTSGELTTLGARYPSASHVSLMRQRISHFSDWDINWGFEPELGAEPPRLSKRPEDIKDPCLEHGSIIECQNQVLGERLPISGTGLTLEYWSSRADARESNRTITIDLASVPSKAKRILAEWSIAGQTWHQVVAIPGPTDPPPSLSFTWNGLDAYGRKVDGKQQLTLRVGFVFGVTYRLSGRFGYSGGPVTITAVRGGGRSAKKGGSATDPRLSGPAPEYADEVTLWAKIDTSLGSASAVAEGTGLWNIGALHSYDPYSHTLTKGTGERAIVDGAVDLFWQHIAGLNNVFCVSASGIPALTACEGTIGGIGVTPAGELLFVRRNYGAAVLSRLSKDTTGTWRQYDLTSGRPASTVGALTVGPDGQVYFVVDNTVLRVPISGGSPTVVAGGGTGLDGAPARSAALAYVGDLAFGPDGSLFILEMGARRVRRIPPARTGIDLGDLPIETFATLPSDTAAMAIGPDGSVYVGKYNLFKVAPTGGLPQKIAGLHVEGASDFFMSGDGGPASAARVAVQAMIVRKDGTLLLKESAFPQSAVRAITPDGIIRRFTLTGSGSIMQREGPAWDATFLEASGRFVEAPNHELFFVDSTPSLGFGVWRLAPSVSLDTSTGFTVVDPHAPIVHRFDSIGRHLDTIDAATKKTLYAFGRDSAQRVNRITDANGEVTSIFRAGESFGGTSVAANHVLIVGPFGQKTELVLNPDGTLQSLANPASEVWSMGWSGGGLLTSLTDPRLNTHSFAWTTDGRLDTDSLPAALGFVQVKQTAKERSKLEVKVKDAKGLEKTHLVEQDIKDAPTVLERRTSTGHDGVSVVSSYEVVGATRVTTTSFADGRSSTVTGTEDPILGFSAPLSKVTTTVPLTSGSLSRTVEATASVPALATWQTMTQRTDTVTVTGTGGTATSASAWTRVLTRNTDGTTTVDMTSPEGRRLRMILDASGRPQRSTFPTDSSLSDVNVSYDRGRISTMVRGARTTSWFYRTDGFLDRIVDAAGRTTQLDELDLVGRVKKATLPAPSGTLSQVQMSYDANGNLTSLTPPGRPGHLFAYDAADRPDTYTAPAVSGGGDLLTKWAYELDGSPKSLKEPDATTPRIQVLYDVFGRVETMRDVGSSIDTVTHYEASGAKRVSSIDRTGSPSLVALYDGARPKGVQWVSGGSVLGSVELEHDNHFRAIGETVNIGSASMVAALGYDRDDLLTSASAGGGTLTLTYSPGAGLLSNVSLAKGAAKVSDARTFNQYGETKTSTTSYTSSTGTVTTLLSFDYHPTEAGTTYARDALGRIVRKTETELVSGTPTTTRYRYGYDLAGRLADVYKNDVLVEHYEYGVNGTRTSATKDGTSVSATYDAQDRLLTYGTTTYTWTPAGRLASKTEGSTTTSYTYDGHGNLLRVTGSFGTIDYVIDPLGRRVGRTVAGATRRWFYDSALRIVGELDPTGTVATQYVYATHPNVPEFAVRGGEVYRIVTDHLGSLRLVVRVSDASVVQRMTYDAWGVVDVDYVAPGWDALPFGFAGGDYDRTTGLNRFRFRDYDATIASWTLTDPAGFRAGLNLLRYVENDPINKLDPAGLWSVFGWASAGAHDGIGAGEVIGIGGYDSTNGVFGGGILGLGVEGEVAGLDLGAYLGWERILQRDALGDGKYHIESSKIRLLEGGVKVGAIGMVCGGYDNPEEFFEGVGKPAKIGHETGHYIGVVIGSFSFGIGWGDDDGRIDYIAKR